MHPPRIAPSPCSRCSRSRRHGAPQRTEGSRRQVVARLRPWTRRCHPHGREGRTPRRNGVAHPEEGNLYSQMLSVLHLPSILVHQQSLPEEVPEAHHKTALCLPAVDQWVETLATVVKQRRLVDNRHSRDHIDLNLTKCHTIDGIVQVASFALARSRSSTPPAAAQSLLEETSIPLATQLLVTRRESFL